ncbi:MAG TPA: alanine--glyoxylate aminotransferase family protein [Candidatus Dormibacteraeota bacterium]|nr:alanine--glyoxylate aminotransferase family protein [Candidatus Dormibacteraeota bacterium]
MNENAGREFLMIPGPVSVDDEVLAALGQPVRAHYGDGWTRLYKHAVEGMREVFKTDGEVHLIFGPGMAGIETCIASVLSPGDEVVVGVNGVFGNRIADVAAANGLTVHVVKPGLAEAVTAAQVREALEEHPNARAVCVVHHETSVGVLNEIQGIGAVAREHGALTIVDGISAVGGVPFEMDAWNVDMCVTVANKCIGGPIGVAPVAAGERALAALDDGRPKAAGWYLNLATWRKFMREWGSWHPHPTTMPTNVIEAFEVALSGLLAEGVENRWRRLASARDRVRGALEEMGFRMLSPVGIASPVTTASYGLPGMNVGDYMHYLLDEHHIRIGGGLGELSGKIFRVGHMGRAAEPAAIDRYLRATADYLEKKKLGAKA